MACFQNREVSFDDKIVHSWRRDWQTKKYYYNVVDLSCGGELCWSCGKEAVQESVAYFMLSLIPAKFSVAVLFVVACFVSTAMGTSVGTITLIAPDRGSSF